MSNWKISRRRFLSSSGGVLLLPLLESLYSPIAAAAGTDPRRFVCFYLPTGTYNVPGDEVWYPKNGAINAANTADVLSPFAANYNDFSVVKYLKMSAEEQTFQKFSPRYPIDLHRANPMSYLTGQMLSGDVQGSTEPYDFSKSFIPGSSFDQIFGQMSGKPTLTLAGHVHPDFTYRTISYLNNKQVDVLSDPLFLFKSTFANITAGTPMAVPANAVGRNKSIIDSSLTDLNNMKAKLGKSDVAKLDDYLTSLRALETKLVNAKMTVAAGQCQPVAAPDGSLSNSGTYGTSVHAEIKIKAFMDMIILAFKCDISRSVSLMYGSEYSWINTNNSIPMNGALIYGGTNLDKIRGTGDDHSMAHYQTNNMGRAEMITRDRVRASLLMYLVNGLKSATDGSGAPILDNTIIMSGYSVEDGEHGNGSLHANARPTIVAGGKGLGLTPGKSIDASAYDIKDLLYTFNTYLGMGLPNFVGANKKIPI